MESLSSCISDASTNSRVMKNNDNIYNIHKTCEGLQQNIISICSTKNDSSNTNLKSETMLTHLAELYPEYRIPNIPFTPSYPIFSHDECVSIINIGSSLGLTTQRNMLREIDTNMFSFNSGYIFANEHTNYIYNRIRDLAYLANSLMWHFDLFDIAEPIKFHKYSGENLDKTCIHSDIGITVTNFRKLTVVVQLSDATAYSDGELMLQSSHIPVIANKMEGSIIIFPSHIIHKVHPVTKGTRYSLVAFIHGPPLK